jgi:tRNA(fMet)-specific endonuclease VapC
MFLLDTDHISILQQRTQPEFSRLFPRVNQRSRSDFYFSIISLHEQVLGSNTFISRALGMPGIIRGYGMLHQALNDFSTAQVLPFDQAAGHQFDLLSAQRIRVGTMDLRIAAIALARGMTVLTRNLRDFRRVPGLTVEDWTV